MFQRVAAVLLMAALAGRAPAEEAPAMLFHDAVIWTGDAALPWAEALWLEDGRIRAVGSDEDLLDRVPAAVPRVPLAGRFVCPGLIDAHAHVLGFGLQLDRVDLVGAVSLEETVARVAGRAAVHRAEERDGWILGRGWDQNDWPVQRFPARQDLDRVTGEVPVSLSRIDGHAIWVNTAALRRAGITRDTPDPPGGRILRDDAGEPTGILVDNAEALVEDVIPDPDRETKARALRRAAQSLLRAGLTGIHDMGMDADDLAVYRGLAASEPLGVRIYAAYSAADPGLGDVLAAGPDREWTDWFRLGMIKFYLDGALGSRGAALLEPYSDEPGHDGLLVTDPNAYERDLERSLAAGFQAAVHAIGDRGNRIALDGWSRLRAGGGAAADPVPAVEAPLSALGGVPARVPRVRVEHAQIIHPDDLDRFAELEAAASMQPTHCTSDMPWAPTRLGEDRLEGAYAWRSLVRRGAVLAAGSDFPVESHDPLTGLYAAVTRRQPDGEPADGWSPAERLGREEALTAFTAAPAYVSGDLHRWGTLTGGKAADLVMFDTNLVTCDPDDILRARVLLTMVGGRVLHRDPELDAAAVAGGR